MNDKLALWINELTPALQNVGLVVTLDSTKVCGALLAYLSVTKTGASKDFIIRFIRVKDQVICSCQNPYVKRDVRLTYRLENVVKVQDYAKHAVETWVNTARAETERIYRKNAAMKLAREQEISENFMPAWVQVSACVEDPKDLGKFRLTFRNYDVGYPLAKLTPAQVKRVVHFLKFIDKEPTPSCTCDCLPCQSCDHR